VSYDVLTPTVARLWPYKPDWGRSFEIKRAFSTDIITSRDNTEQRRAIRTDPRLSAQYRAVVSGADRRAADHHLRAWQNKPVVVPDFARWARLTSLSLPGSSALTVSPMPTWVAAGQPLVLCKAGVASEQVVVQGVIGMTISLEDPLVSGWAVGDVLRPTFFGLFDGRLSSQRFNGDTVGIDVVIDCYPGGEPPRDAGAAWASLGGVEIFTPLPDYAGSPSVGHVWPVDQIDYGRGRTAQFRPVESMARELEAEFNGLDPSLAMQLEQFFDRMKGRRTAFYVPTWEGDFVLGNSPGSGSTTFIQPGSALFDDFGDIDFSIVNEGVAVCLTDGTILYRRITDISLSGSDSLVTVNAAWGVALSGANVARISRMPLSRFASDEMVTSWRTPLTASSRLTFTQVNA
jgi:hypothetical protein